MSMLNDPSEILRTLLYSDANVLGSEPTKFAVTNAIFEALENWTVTLPKPLSLEARGILRPICPSVRRAGNFSDEEAENMKTACAQIAELFTEEGDAEIGRILPSPLAELKAPGDLDQEVAGR